MSDPSADRIAELEARVASIEAMVREMKALAKGDPGRDGKDGRDGRDGKSVSLSQVLAAIRNSAPSARSFGDSVASAISRLPAPSVTVHNPPPERVSVERTVVERDADGIPVRVIERPIGATP